MALIAEELVQEWLNRQGYFTIRGARLGNHELDLLAVKVKGDGSLHCRHIEVNVSVNPIGYMGPQRSAKRQSVEQQRENARHWVQTKFQAKGKQALRDQLAPGQQWSLEVVLHKLRGPDQLTAILEAGVKTLRLSDIIGDLRNPAENVENVLSAAGGHSLSELLTIGESTTVP
jgi:Holliday junction resolvase-like predicted endonuclease